MADRWIAGVAAGVVAAVGIFAGVAMAARTDSSAGPAGLPPAGITSTTSGDGSPVATNDGSATTTTHNHGSVVAGSASGDSPCELSGGPASPGQTAGTHGERGLVKQKPLTRDERVLLEQQQTLARAVALKYPTVATAQAAGYRMSTSFVPCIGAHYTNISLATKFDISAPSELLYDGTAPDSKIVGLSYLVWHPGGAPDGFAGPNDLWHQHNANGGLCLNPAGTVIGGEDMLEATCTQIGGKKTVLADIWMLHDWIVPGWECTWGVFAGECPELGGKLGQSAWA